MCSLLDVNYTIFLHNRNIITVRFQFLNPGIIFTVSSEIRVAYFDQIENRYLKHISSPWNLLNLHGCCDRLGLPCKKKNNVLQGSYILPVPVGELELVAKFGSAAYHCECLLWKRAPIDSKGNISQPGPWPSQSNSFLITSITTVMLFWPLRLHPSLVLSFKILFCKECNQLLTHLNSFHGFICSTKIKSYIRCTKCLEITWNLLGIKF